MSVELLDTPRFHGYRVRRQVAGKTYQEYFSLKDAGKRVTGARRQALLRRARARDGELARLQRQARKQRARDLQLDADGNVRGILFRLKREKSGARSPVFQVGIKSQRDDRIVNTTVSIRRHGLERAWRRAVAFYAMHKQIGRRSETYRQLLAAQPTPERYRQLLAGAE